MAISKRENAILWTTIAVIAAYVLWAFGIGPVYESYLEMVDKYDQEFETYQTNTKTLAESAKIEREFKAIEASFPKDDPNREPEFAFQEDVLALTERVLGRKLGPQERSTNPVYEEMKDAKDYSLLSFSLTTVTDLPHVSTLLKNFDQKGFLIRSVTITKPNIDNPELSLEVTLGRMVKNLPEEPDASTDASRKGAPRPGLRRTR